MIPGSYVQQVACGWNHTLLLNDLGQVYAAGSGTFGQLGIAGVPADGSIALGGWTQVPAPVGSVFVRIACGIRHSLALDQDGLVYGWGANRCGQLGIPPDKRSPNIPTMALVSQGLPPIAMIACGRSHSILVAQDRRTVFVAGQDKYAQCGPATSHMVAGTWRTFQLPRDAIKACSGWDFGAILLGEPTDGDEERGIGNVVVWGRGDHGQVAQRVENGCLRDLGYIAVAGVCDMVCGSSHVVALTQDGSVYMWGWNEHGNAGNPNLENIFTPLCVHDGHGNPDNRAVSIGCGYGNSYVVS
ncbi:alpha tubulin suppressor [Coemansia thaxteri]|uniref:Alpha tubulin suppressor n=1 Tax=Coemansia thaxteri TaxID=2663907 RepID=A0A9W8ED59_9FUNG|nr:alpha tubulin suppressor [Coemansia thaxteri]